MHQPQSLDIHAGLTITLHPDGRATAQAEVAAQTDADVNLAIARWQRHINLAHAWLAARGRSRSLRGHREPVAPPNALAGAGDPDDVEAP